MTGFRSPALRSARLRAGNGYTVPGGIEHEAIAGPEGALVLDAFRLVREDYRAAAGV